MMAAWLPALVLLPALHGLGALLLALLPTRLSAPRWGALLNLGFAAGGLVLALALLAVPLEVEGLLHLDALNLLLVLLAALVGLGTASGSAATLAAAGLTPGAQRAYHAAFQLFLGAIQLALLADHLGLMWLALEAATIAGVVMVALQRSPAAIAAAWKFLILCGLGIALALFGTILLALAAQPFAGGGETALSFTALLRIGREADPGLLTLAFIVLLVGYGTLAGLVPLQSWLPDAHAAGPVAVPALLSGLLLPAALHAILRARALVGLHPQVISPGALLMALGLASLLLAAAALWRRRDARRFLAWGSVAQLGLASFAFGLGGPAALAGLLLLLSHVLVQSALFLAVGAAGLAGGTQRLADLRGLATGQPWLGLPIVLGLLALAGLPPFAGFAGDFLLLQQTAARLPWLLPPLGLGLLLAALAVLAVLQAICLGSSEAAVPDEAPGEAPREAPGVPAPILPADRLARWAVAGPVALQLGLALLLGIALPAPLRDWLAAAAGIVQ